MSETSFHLLGPGMQPNDDNFSMSPLSITCRMNGEPSMAALEQYAHSPQMIALLNELQHQLSKRQPPLGEVPIVDLLNPNADDRHFINTPFREEEVSVRIQQADDSESEIQEVILCGLWRIRRRHGEQLLENKLEAGCIPLALWQMVTQSVLPIDSLLPSSIDSLINGLPLAHELPAHVRSPDVQSHSIDMTQLPISEADRPFFSRLCGPGNIQIRTIGYGESYINATGLCHVWHLHYTDTLRGPSLESYEICLIPEVVPAVPEDLVDSAQRFSKVYQWLAEGALTQKDGRYRFQAYEYRNRRIPLVVEFQDKEGDLPLAGYFSLFAYRSAHVERH